LGLGVDGVGFRISGLEFPESSRIVWSRAAFGKKEDEVHRLRFVRFVRLYVCMYVCTYDTYRVDGSIIALQQGEEGCKLLLGQGRGHRLEDAPHPRWPSRRGLWLRGASGCAVCRVVGLCGEIRKERCGGGSDVGREGRRAADEYSISG
jgi:hypothetical protein